MSKRSQQLYKEFTDLHNYDVRITKNGRWIDQKCTPDILALVVDSMIHYMSEKETDIVTSKNIWDSEYSRELVMELFKKADPWSKAAKNEYDKVFQQPLKMLSHAGILSESKINRRIHFRVANMEILETLKYEMNALDFIAIYVEKVLKDSGLWEIFSNFFKEQNKDSYHLMKEEFVRFTINNTPINKPTECRRIFIKVLNSLAFFKNTKGTEGGHISKSIIQRSDLMYNRDNFRDINKPKNMTRKEYAATNPDSKFSCNILRYMSEKEKKFVRTYNEKYNGGKSEIQCLESYGSLQIHHIFMASEHPELSYYRENLIALTPTQHLSFAHPNNDTNTVDPKYRCRCLLNKLNTIMIDNQNGIFEYDIEKFKEILAIGFSDESFMNINGNNFDQIKSKIYEICNNKYMYESANA